MDSWGSTTRKYKDVGTRCGSVAWFYYGRDVTNWHFNRQ